MNSSNLNWPRFFRLEDESYFFVVPPSFPECCPAVADALVLVTHSSILFAAGFNHRQLLYIRYELTLHDVVHILHFFFFKSPFNAENKRQGGLSYNVLREPRYCYVISDQHFMEPFCISELYVYDRENLQTTPAKTSPRLDPEMQFRLLKEDE